MNSSPVTAIASSGSVLRRILRIIKQSSLFKMWLPMLSSAAVSAIAARITCIALLMCSIAPASDFSQGSFTLDSAVIYTRALGRNDADVGAIEIGVNYYLFNRFSLGVALAG